jgi:hypothetical protein
LATPGAYFTGAFSTFTGFPALAGFDAFLPATFFTCFFAAGFAVCRTAGFADSVFAGAGDWGSAPVAASAGPASPRAVKTVSNLSERVMCVLLAGRPRVAIAPRHLRSLDVRQSREIHGSARRS